MNIYFLSHDIQCILYLVLLYEKILFKIELCLFKGSTTGLLIIIVLFLLICCTTCT